LKPSRDFSTIELQSLTEYLVNNFYIAQVNAFKCWYCNRYTNQEYSHVQQLLPSLNYFEVRKCENGALAIIMSTCLTNSVNSKEVNSLLIFNQHGAFSRYELNDSSTEGLISTEKMFQYVLDNSVPIYCI
jgi:hypothetical protein